MSAEVDKDYPITRRVDARGLSCPLPLLKAKQALNRLQPGEVLQVLATDAGSVRDFKAFTDQSGDLLLYSSEESGEESGENPAEPFGENPDYFRYLICKAGA
ncbi:MAG: tRNA 2-thiouridine synthesizing protein A [Motiliproteus sp.]|jgi:tRNA 2-thiouridine synthesizing protein A